MKKIQLNNRTELKLKGFIKISGFLVPTREMPEGMKKTINQNNPDRPNHIFNTNSEIDVSISEFTVSSIEDSNLTKTIYVRFLEAPLPLVVFSGDQYDNLPNWTDEDIYKEAEKKINELNVEQLKEFITAQSYSEECLNYVAEKIKAFDQEMDKKHANFFLPVRKSAFIK
jgi:hypothetical protein